MIPFHQAAADVDSSAGGTGTFVKMFKPNNQGSSVLYRVPDSYGGEPAQAAPAAVPPTSGGTSTQNENESGMPVSASFDSNLSLRDMYNDILNNQKEYFQDNDDHESDEDDTKQSKTQNEGGLLSTPPTSLHATTGPTLFPPSEPLPGPLLSSTGSSAAGAVSSFVGSAASSNASSVPRPGSIPGGSIQQQQQQPMLYSAIGSLEDSNSSSYEGWKQKAAATCQGKVQQIRVPFVFCDVGTLGQEEEKCSIGK